MSPDEEFRPERIYQEIVSSGQDWADKNAAAELLEETKKSVLAELINGASGTSQSAKESMALADPAYRLHLTNMVTARKQANIARMKYDAVRVLAEMRRTQESTRRAEANIR